MDQGEVDHHALLHQQAVLHIFPIPSLPLHLLLLLIILLLLHIILLLFLIILFLFFIILLLFPLPKKFKTEKKNLKTHDEKGVGYALLFFATHVLNVLHFFARY